jgi:hypothetical protein
MRDRERGEEVIKMKNSAFLESSVSQASETIIKKEEHKKECEQAAALIQRSFRKHSEERALDATSDDAFSPDASAAFKPSLAQASLVLGDSTSASTALSGSFHNEDQSSISEDYSSNEDEDQFEDEHDDAPKGELAVLTESYYEGGNEMEEEKEEEKEPPLEQAPEKRSGKYLWGVAAGAVGIIGAVVVHSAMSGGPVDEDDVVGVTGMVHSGGGGGGGAGGGGGGAGGGTTGATTSAQ